MKVAAIPGKNTEPSEVGYYVTWETQVTYRYCYMFYVLANNIYGKEE